ncbi:MAG: phosphoribosyltransferase [Bdellovibrionota bacterium]
MLEIFEYISTDATKSQEQKTLRGRKGASKMRIHSWDAIKTATTPLIFVDDVVTSGATVESAIQTLKPFHFDRVICLANRGKLAQESLF